MKIYTVGYNAWSFYEFKTKIEELDNILVDVRYSPNSFNPFWGKKNLLKHFKGNYVHIPNLGNVNYKNGKPIKVCNIDKGCKQLLKQIGDNDCLLLCACEDVETCHRKVVAAELYRLTLCDIVNLKGEE